MHDKLFRGVKYNADCRRRPKFHVFYVQYFIIIYLNFRKCLLDVWLCMLKLVVCPKIQNQAVMGTKFNTRFEFGHGSLIFQVIGLNNDLEPLVSMILERFDKFEEEATEQLFNLCKQHILSSYYAMSVNPKNLAQ